jgi:hypothetical protein
VLTYARNRRRQLASSTDVGFRRFDVAQGLPYVLVPRELSREEWIERYSKQS